jgi:probable HAF family extracellular repeat protein
LTLHLAEHESKRRLGFESTAPEARRRDHDKYVGRSHCREFRRLHGGPSRCFAAGWVLDAVGHDGHRACPTGWFAESAATGINEQGEIVGYAHATSGEDVAVVWQNGRVNQLPSLGGTRSAAVKVNSAGQIVGWSEPVSGVHLPYAVLWSDGALKDLGTLGGDACDALSINSLGSIVGWARTAPGTTPGGGRENAFEYTQGRMVDLLSDGGAQTFAYDINDSGQIVGADSAHGVLVSNGGTTVLPPLPGDLYSWATAINRSGLAAGYSWNSTRMDAVLWQGVAPRDLGVLPGRQSSMGDAINSSADVVGGSGNYVSGPGAVQGAPNHAFLYRAGAMLDLNDMLPPVQAGRWSKPLISMTRARSLGLVN